MEVRVMPRIKYRVLLTEKEQKKLKEIISKGSSSAKIIMHANVLLALDESSGRRQSDQETGKQFHVHFQSVHTIRRTFAETGLEAALGRKKRMTPPVPAKITGDIEARVIALSCSEPPEGRSKWTLRLLADKVIELEIMESISYVSVGEILKKTNSNHT
jgi:hypothetical protein